MKPLFMFAVSCASLLHAGAIQSGSTVTVTEMFVPDDLFWTMNITTAASHSIASGTDLNGPALVPLTSLNISVTRPGPGTYNILTSLGTLTGPGAFNGTSFLFNIDPFTGPANPLPGQKISVVTPFTMSGVINIRMLNATAPIFYSENVFGSGFATYTLTGGLFPAANQGYTFTFTPEPNSFSMIAVGGLLTCAAAAFRRKRLARTGASE